MDIISKKKLLEETEYKYDYLYSFIVEFQTKINDNYDIGTIDTQEKYRLLKRLNILFIDLDKIYKQMKKINSDIINVNVLIDNKDKRVGEQVFYTFMKKGVFTILCGVVSRENPNERMASTRLIVVE